MASYSFKLPDLGEGTVDSEIVAWRVNVGDPVGADQPLVDMMTDKATIEITAPVSGKLMSVAGAAGDVIAVGAELAVFATDGEQPSRHDEQTDSSFPRRRESSKTESRSQGDTSNHVPVPGYRPIPGRYDEQESQTRHDGEGGDTSQPAPAAGKPLTSPAIRRLAREHDIDLGRVPGSGPKGRITRADIDAVLEQTGKPSPDDFAPAADGTRETNLPGADLDVQRTPKGGAPGNAPGKVHITNLPGADLDVRRAPEGGAPGKVHITKLQGLRRKIADRMTLSASRIPHFSYVEEVDVTELERLRRHLNDERQAHQVELTYLPFFMQALVKVVEEFPQCNAHFDDDRQVITQFEPVHAGIAVQTGGGLMVPVIRHVETLDLWQCAHELRQIADKARQGNARREELTGSTITITSLGALGGIVSTPIINYPEVAIIGINRTQQRPVFDNNGVTTRLMMNISSSFDHRVVDGYDAACAIQALKRYLEFPATLFLPPPRVRHSRESRNPVQ